MQKKEDNRLKHSNTFLLSFIVFFGIYFLLNYLFLWDSSGNPKIKPSYIHLILFILIFLFGALIRGRKLKKWRFFLFFPAIFLFFYILSCFLLQGKPGYDYSLLTMNFLIFFLVTVIFSIIREMRESGTIVRNILYIAGKSIGNYTDGYTTRPYPYGKINAPFDELIEFAGFLQKKFIGTVYYEDEIILIAFSSGVYQYIPGMEPDWNKVTYISINNDGKITVKISRRDYKKFVKEVSFDELCIRFGEMIIDLFNRYKKGERNEIKEYIIYSYKSVSFIDKEAKNRIISCINYINTRPLVLLSLTFLLLSCCVYFLKIDFTLLLISILFLGLLKVFLKTESSRAIPLVYLIISTIISMNYFVLLLSDKYFHMVTFKFFLVSIPVAGVLHLFIYLKYRVNIFKRYKMYFFPKEETTMNTGKNIYTEPFIIRINNYNRIDFLYFTYFLTKNLIATVYYRDHNTYVILSNGLFQYIPFLVPNLKKATYIVIEENGEVKVHVSKKDYFNYSNGLKMEELSEYIGEVFINLYACCKLSDAEDLLNLLNEGNQNKEAGLIY